MMLDDRGVTALGKVSEERKQRELAAAAVVCAPSLHGESFGMVLTEAFDDGARDGADGLLVPPGDPIALAEALRRLALDEPLRARMARSARERAERFAWPHVAAEVLDCYEQAIHVGAPAGSGARLAVRLGLAPADLRPRIPAERLPSLRAAEPRPALSPAARGARALRAGALALLAVIGVALALLASAHVGLDRVAAS